MVAKSSKRGRRGPSPTLADVAKDLNQLEYDYGQIKDTLQLVLDLMTTLRKSVEKITTQLESLKAP